MHDFVHVAYGGGSVLLLRLCDTLCSSGFVDDRGSTDFDAIWHDDALRTS